MTDETDEEGSDIDFEQSVPEFVTCHNHVIVFPWGSDMLCAHLNGLALRIDARDASIEVFDDTDHRWRVAEKTQAAVTSINSGKRS